MATENKPIITLLEFRQHFDCWQCEPPALHFKGKEAALDFLAIFAGTQGMFWAFSDDTSTARIFGFDVTWGESSGNRE